MLQTGIKGKKEITVTLDKTAKAMGSGTMDVFATPAMIALMENTAFESVASELEEGSGTHERFIVFEEKFQKKADDKAK